MARSKRVSSQSMDEVDHGDLEVVLDEVLSLGMELGGASDHNVEAVIRWMETHPDSSPAVLALLGRFLLHFWGSDFTPEWMGRDLWLRAFRAVGFASDSGRSPPTRSLVVYRGATERSLLGMSRTTSSGWAKAHADKEWNDELFGPAPGPRLVWRAVIPPAGVLARIDNRPEHEVVVDPDFLRSIRRFGKSSPSRAGSSRAGR